MVDIRSALSWIAGAGASGASKAAFWSATNSLRLELAPQGTLVVGVRLGSADTDLTTAVAAPKLDPRDVARAVVDGVDRTSPRFWWTPAGTSSRPSPVPSKGCPSSQPPPAELVRDTGIVGPTTI